MWICDTCKLPRYDSPVGLATPQCMCMWRQNTAPPKREWVGLTDEELSGLYNLNYDDYVNDNVGIVDFLMIAGSVEAKLKEKNRGL